MADTIWHGPNERRLDFPIHLGYSKPSKTLGDIFMTPCEFLRFLISFEAYWLHSTLRVINSLSLWNTSFLIHTDASNPAHNPLKPVGCEKKEIGDLTPNKHTADCCNNFIYFFNKSISLMRLKYTCISFSITIEQVLTKFMSFLCVTLLSIYLLFMLLHQVYPLTGTFFTLKLNLCAK